MSETTRVPLPPVRGLGKLWLGVFALVLAGVVLAGVGRPPLVAVKTLIAGSGPNPQPGDYVLMDLAGRLDNGFVFQPEATMPLRMGSNIPGFDRALAQMQAGGTYDVQIPPELGYGDRKDLTIPPNSPLKFHIRVIAFEPAEQFERQRMMMEQMRRRQSGGAGAAGAANATPPGGSE